MLFVRHGELVLGLALPREVVGGRLEGVEAGHGSVDLLGVHGESLKSKVNKRNSQRPFIGRI